MHGSHLLYGVCHAYQSDLNRPGRMSAAHPPLPGRFAHALRLSTLPAPQRNVGGRRGAPAVRPRLRR